MALTLTTDQLAGAITDILEEYSGLVEEDVQRITQAAGKKTMERIRAKASSAGIGGTGKYKKNWASKYKAKAGGAEATVYNKDTYRLTHLLEYGHAKVNGGRVKAYPHIGEAEKEAIAEFERDLKEAIQK